ncbi:MAG: hypothetical protein H7144_06875 [Burkholderiales bacterium]|nr:hypothetical protein [Phycisphaerae bacterium]
MKRTILNLSLALAMSGLPLSVGCDRTVSESETTKERSDGTVSTSKEKTTVSPDGDVKTTRERTVDK